MVNFDKIYCISLLQKRPTKFAQMIERLPKNWNLGTIEPYDAVDGSIVPLPLWWNKRLAGSYGCYLSHINILKKIVKHKYVNTLILEDDVIFKTDFVKNIISIYQNLPSDWDQLYLGGQHLGKAKRITNDIVKGSNINRTHAYVVKNDNSANTILKYLTDKNFWIKYLPSNRYHIDHAYGVLHKQNIINAYACKPFLVGQLSNKYSDTGSQISTVDRWWN